MLTCSLIYSLRSLVIRAIRGKNVPNKKSFLPQTVGKCFEVLTFLRFKCFDALDLVLSLSDAGATKNNPNAG